MAGAKAQTIRLKPVPPVPGKSLRSGMKFRRWDEDEGDVLLQVDETGLVLSILSDRQEGVPLHISEISDVRCGKYARQPKDPKLFDALAASAGVASFDDIAISITHGVNMVDVNYINLAATQRGDAALFQQEMSKLLRNVIGTNVSEEIMLRREYARLCALRDPEKDGIAVKHLQALFEAKPKDDFRSVMAFFGWDTGPKDYVPFAEFTPAAFFRLYEDVVPMEYISDMFTKIRMTKGSKPYVTVKEFCRFLNEHQRDPRLNEILFPYVKPDDVQQIVTAMEPNKDYAAKGQLTAQGLRNYIRSKENAAIHLSRFSLHQDMDQPLCHYYINSSHNTYLTGHQLRGRATVEIYRQVLLSGCRCIELDCWDGDDDEPVITHGKTLVNNIPFKDVIEAINESAFKASLFPVILSFENHCRFRQQRRMVGYLRSILGDKLLVDPLEDYPVVPGQVLPPPSRLLGKIICKNKLMVPKEQRGRDDDGMGTLPRHGGGGGGGDGTYTLPRSGKQSTNAFDEEEAAEARSSSPVKDQANPETVESCVDAQTQDESSADGSVRSDSRRVSDDCWTTSTRDPANGPLNEGAIVEAGEFGNGATEVGTAQTTTGYWSELDMPSLVNYAEPIKFRTFLDAEQLNKHYQMCSFAETAGVRWFLDFPKELLKFTQRQNTRIYPKGTRVDSSNYQPQVFWNAGCQMVSLNFQTLDLPMQLNQGKFDYNGKCGYLIKPEVMRHSDRDFDPFVESPIANIVAATMKVEVLAGHMLSTTKDKVLVEVDMYGIPADTVRRKFKTKAVQNDVTVNFRSASFEFKKVILPDLAILRFSVYDSQGTLLGMRILPFDGLEPGFRYIHLNNDNNQPLPLACLFVNLEMKEYIPAELADFATALMNPVAYLKEQRTQALGAMVDYDITELNEGDARRPSDVLENGMPTGALAAVYSQSGNSASPPSVTPSTSSSSLAAMGGVPAAASASAAASPRPVTGPDPQLLPQRRYTVAPLTVSTHVDQRSMSIIPDATRKVVFVKTPVTGPRDVLAGKDVAKPMGKISKELSSIRKKFLKTQASAAKSQAAVVKKNNGNASALEAMHAFHEQELIKLARKALEDEQSAVLKILPALFASTAKALASRHAAEVKQFEDRYKKQLAEISGSMQKETAQKLHQYQEDQKKKVADKDELQRKVREYRNKLVEGVVQHRQQGDRTRETELEGLEKSQQAAVADLRIVEEMEEEHVTKTYSALVHGCTSHDAVEAYITAALEDKGLALACLTECP